MSEEQDDQLVAGTGTKDSACAGVKACFGFYLVLGLLVVVVMASALASISFFGARVLQ